VEDFRNRDIGLKSEGVESWEGVHKGVVPQPKMVPEGGKSAITHPDRGNLMEFEEAIKNTRSNSCVRIMSIPKISKV
jgi:hypothetical protein